MGVINKLLGRLKLYADPSVTTQTTTVVQASTTNSSLALVPNGTGAIIASVPDGTATGGNARGQYAVDLQISRTSNTKIASGNYSFIGGGLDNIAPSNYSGVLSGQNNTAQNVHAVVIGGFQNISSGAYSVSGGLTNTASAWSSVTFGNANNASSNYSTISGGQSNTASTNTHATVVGGQSNTSSGLQSVVGGVSNTGSGQAVFVVNGSNTATSSYGSAFGFGTNVSGNSALGFGGYALAYLEAQLAQGSGRFAATGDAQNSVVTARRQADLTTGATATLSLSGNGTTLLIIPNSNNRAWNVQIDTIAVVTAITGTATGVSVGDCYRETKQLLFKRIGGTSSIVGSVDTTAIKSDTSMSTALLDVTAGGSQQMALTFTAPTFAGGGSVTVRVVSKVMLVEVAY